jgi:hypothetical protein
VLSVWRVFVVSIDISVFFGLLGTDFSRGSVLGKFIQPVRMFSREVFPLSLPVIPLHSNALYSSITSCNSIDTSLIARIFLLFGRGNSFTHSSMINICSSCPVNLSFNIMWMFNQNYAIIVIIVSVIIIIYRLYRLFVRWSQALPVKIFLACAVTRRPLDPNMSHFKLIALLVTAISPAFL